MNRLWGWFRKGDGGWERRKYDPRDETPEEGPPDREEFWNGQGGASCTRLLTEHERDALFIQTGQDFTTLHDAEKYGEDHGFRIVEQSEKNDLQGLGEYDKKVTKHNSAMNLKVAKKLLTSNPEYSKNAREGGIHAEQARAEGRG